MVILLKTSPTLILPVLLLYLWKPCMMYQSKPNAFVALLTFETYHAVSMHEQRVAALHVIWLYQHTRKHACML